MTNQVRASGTAPLNYHWEFNGMPIMGVINRTLILTNVQLVHAGSYTAVVSDTGGSVPSVPSRVATLTVDPTFTKITTGPVVSDGGSSVHGGWADYDGDGYLDLFVSNGTFGGGAGEKNFLYRNNGDGTFTKITTGVIVSEQVDSSGGAWGDYDNDGYPDLFVPNKVLRNDLLYRNNGDGSFTKILTGSVVTNGQFASGGAAWADFDNDGYLDLYVPVSNIASPNRLYRNNGGGTFSRMTNNRTAVFEGTSVNNLDRMQGAQFVPGQPYLAETALADRTEQFVIGNIGRKRQVSRGVLRFLSADRARRIVAQRWLCP